MDRLPHALPRARPSTNRTSLVHRRSRSRTIRPPGRLPGRVFFRFPPHHSTRHLRRCLCTLLAGGPARRSGLWIRHRASTARPQSIDGAPALCATPGRPLQLLPRPPSPNLEQITCDDGQCCTLSREAPHECSPPRKLWVLGVKEQAREERKKELPHRLRRDIEGFSPLSGSALSATIYGVSLLTDTTGGSTLSIRKHSNQTSLLITYCRGGEDGKNWGDFRVEVTFAPPLHGSHLEMDGKLAVTRLGFAKVWGARLRIAERLLPSRLSFLRTVRSPDGRFDPTRCRYVDPSWHRKPSRCRFAGFPSDPSCRANPPHRAPRT